jgi:MoaA/NifB/PqqE/SkfB family radical SAM enzyme
VLDFPTTGQRTDRIVSDVSRIARLGVPRLYVTVSLEGPPPLHDRLRGRPGAFARAVETFSALRRTRGVSAYLGFTLSDRNADALPAAVAAVRERVPDLADREVHANVVTLSSHYYDNLEAGVSRPPDARRTLAGLLRSRRARPFSPTDWLEAAYLSRVARHVRTGRSPLPCKSLRASVFVAASGEVHPCTVYARPLGNAYERPLPEVLATEAAEAARREVAEDRCPGCWSPCEAYQTVLGNLPRALAGA